MKTKLLALTGLLVLILLSCESDNKQSGNINFNDIRLEIYSVKYSYIVMNQEPGDMVFPGYRDIEYKFYKTITMPEEGGIEINLQDTLSTSFFMYAKRKGFFTNIYYFLNGDSINIDLDTIPSGKIAGVIFGQSECSLPYYITELDLPIISNGDTAFTLHLDSMGRYIVDQKAGDFEIEFPSGQFTHFYTSGFYFDYNINFGDDYCAFVEKPNIYIYPEAEMSLDIKLFFPRGGSVVRSYPQYNKGWNNISVSPDGRINGEHGYLFYESANPDLFQYKAGWIVPKVNLESFFTQNMKESGFNSQEIGDFIEHWIPLLHDEDSYAIYPQYNETLDKMIQLRVSEKPETLIRLIYCIKVMDSNTQNPEIPVIPDITRKGFTITEWGVVRK